LNLAVSKLVPKFPNIKFRFVILSETLGVESEKNKQDVEDRKDEILKSLQIIDTTKIQLHFADTSYILGEDVDSQTGADSKESVIVFKGSNQTLVAYSIKPSGETTTREIAIAIGKGVFNGKLPNVL